MTTATVLLLSMRLPTEAFAIVVFLMVGPLTVIALVFAYVALQVYRHLNNVPQESIGRAWRVTKRATLLLGGALWLGLTILFAWTPSGPRPEIAAIANLRTVNTAEVTYLSSAGGAYGAIPDLISAGLLDSRFEGPVSGYMYSVTTSGSDYTATAFPVSTKIGQYGYFSGTDGLIRYAGEATPTCAPCFPKGMAGQRIP